MLAAERTFLAWTRTGLALMGFGFVVARFGLFLRELAGQRGDMLPAGYSRWFGVALVAAGVVVAGGALRMHVKRLARLRRGQALTETAPPLAFAVALALALVGVLLVTYLALASR